MEPARDSEQPQPKASYVGMRSRQRIGRSLRSARRQAGLTQAETAELAGVSRESVSLLENGHRSMRIETLNAVLDVLGYNIAFLPRSPDEQALRDQARSYHIIETVT